MDYTQNLLRIENDLVGINQNILMLDDRINKIENASEYISGEIAEIKNNQSIINATGLLIAIILALIIIYEFITRSMKC